MGALAYQENPRSHAGLRDICDQRGRFILRCSTELDTHAGAWFLSRVISPANGFANSGWVLGMASFKTVVAHGAPHSVLKTRLLPRASDGRVLAAQYDAAGNLIEAQGTAADGKRHGFAIHGDWPNQTAVFSENDEVYLAAKSTLERIPVAWPRLGVRSTYIFSYHLSSPRLSLLYEVLPAAIAPEKRLRLFAVVKSVPSDQDGQWWQLAAALHGTYDYDTLTFPPISRPSSAFQIRGARPSSSTRRARRKGSWATCWAGA